MHRRITVEALVPAPVEEVWARSLDHERHMLWDIRFDEIRAEGWTDGRGFAELQYRTRLGFGMQIEGTGRYLGRREGAVCSFEFGSEDPRSLIAEGKGAWVYRPAGEWTHFKTVYDYRVRYRALGQAVDRVFRPVMQLATEWSFETLRRWCAGDEGALARRRNRWRFLPFLARRMAGARPPLGEARSWIGKEAAS
ncbi:MAG TPA: hypothetical protein VIG99_01095 [Myxococcaceae bacterium]|jgi:hypothetical protein